jgi:hypothetical protein
MSTTAWGAAVMMAYAGVAELPAWMPGAQYNSPWAPAAPVEVIVPAPKQCAPGFEVSGPGLGSRCVPDCRTGCKRVRLAEEQTVLRDSQGRTIGTATPQGDGTVKFRDSQGRSVGSATTDPSGTTRYYGPGGNSLGSSSGPARPAFPEPRK